jgi:hypothetical protein
MKTIFLLMAQYDGQAAVSVDVIARDYFGVDLEARGLPRFLSKVESGEIPLPLMRMERSQKGARLVSLQDLADYLDERRAAAVKELQQLRA